MPRPSKFDSIQPAGGATDIRSALKPIVPLAKVASSVFASTLRANPHLGPSDTVLLTCFSQTAEKVLAGKASAAQQERLGRLLIAYGRSLRITAVVDARTANRRRQTVRPQGGFGLTWQQLQDQGDDDDDDDDLDSTTD